MSLIKSLKQGVFGLTLLAMLASGCSFKRENARGSFFTLPFLPYTWVTYENLDKEGNVTERNEIKVNQGFINSSMTVERYDLKGKYLGKYLIRKKGSGSMSTGRGETWRRETVVAMGRATRARMMGGGYGSSSIETNIYDEKGEFVETKGGTPSDVPRDFPFSP